MSKLDDETRSAGDSLLLRQLARTPKVAPFAGTKRYRVCNCLGEGGFGVVYEVEDRQLGRRMALKTLKPQRTGFAANIRRLKSEFRSVADLVHPNLVGLHELSTEEGRWFFTMDLVRGYDFLEYVSGDTALAYTRTGHDRDAQPAARKRDSSGILSEVRLRASLRQLVAGVSALHAAGIIHRDLKPSNVLVEPDGRVVVLDFGLAGVASAVEMDVSLRCAGTPAYMAPEQADDDAPVTPAADWYAVGVMLYEALSGQLPFDDESGPKLAEKWTRDPAPPSTHRRVPADLERLCLALLHRKPEQRPDAAAIVAMIGQGPAPRDPRRRDQGAFVGRRRELDLLRAAHERLLRGQPSVVRIEGHPGVGKSALLQRFLDELPAESALLTGRCHEREWVPFKAFDGVVDALVRYLRTLPRNEASGLLPRDIHLVLQLFPTLEAVAAVRDIPRRQVSPIDPSETRLRAFAALKELLARVADKQPLVIAIDDLQWGDIDSARLLAQLIAPPDRPTLLILLAHRRDDSEHAQSLREMLRVLGATDDGQAEIALEPLSSEDAEHLAAQLLGGADRLDDAARVIAQRAEGHPLFMEELARAHLGDPKSGPPPSLMDILWQRVGRLSEGARALLETVAVAGQPLPASLCFEAAGLSGAGLDAVRTLRAEQLIVTADSGAINVFHDRVRDTILDRLGTVDKRERHLALARSLEERPEPDLENVARHYDAADVPEQAAHYAQRAGDLAMRTLAFDRAAALYRMALERGGDAGHRLYEKLGDALRHAGSDADAGEAFLAASARTAGADAVQLTARAAELLLAVGRYDAGEQAIERALAAVGESLPATARRSLFEGLGHFILMRLGGFRFRERDAAAIAPERLLRLDVLASAAYGMMNANFMRAIGPIMRFSRMALKTGEPRRAGLALIHATAALEGRTRPPKIDELLDRAEAIAERLSDAKLRALAMRSRATSYFMYGDFPNAQRVALSADTLISEQCAGMGIDQRFVRMVAAHIEVDLGNLQHARRIAESELLAAVERRDPVAERAICICALGHLSLAADEPDLARQYLARVSLEDRCANVLFGVAASSDLAMYLGRPREAVDGWRRRWAQIKEEGLLMPPAFRIIAVRSLATALLDQPEGRADVREAARLLRSIRGYRFPLALAVCSSLRAYLAVHEGRTDRAAVLLLEAAHHFDDASLFLDGAACRYRHAQIAGGDEGSAQRAAAEAFLHERGIACPERWVAMKLPPIATRVLSAG